MKLVPSSRRAAGPGRRAALRPLPLSDGYARVEDQVARTADLVLKVHGLLERAQGLEAQPERAARMARLAAVVEHGQVALRRAAEVALETGTAAQGTGVGSTGVGSTVPWPRTSRPPRTRTGWSG